MADIHPWPFRQEILYCGIRYGFFLVLVGVIHRPGGDATLLFSDPAKYAQESKTRVAMCQEYLASSEFSYDVC